MERFVNPKFDVFLIRWFQSLATVDEKGSNLELDNLSPPIMTEGGTKNGLTEKEYTEYFMPVNEHKKSFRC